MKKRWCYHCKEKRHVVNHHPRRKRGYTRRGGPNLWCKTCLRRIVKPLKTIPLPIVGQRRGLLYTIRQLATGE